eukprot:gene4537-823_t
MFTRLLVASLVSASAAGGIFFETELAGGTCASAGAQIQSAVGSNFQTLFGESVDVEVMVRSCENEADGAHVYGSVEMPFFSERAFIECGDGQAGSPSPPRRPYRPGSALEISQTAAVYDMPAVAPARPTGTGARLRSRVAPWLRQMVESGRLPGAAVRVAQGGTVLLDEVFGCADVAIGTSLKIYRIYSMTKPITTVAAMMLFEDGEFLLDDAVAKFLPDFSTPQASASVVHLLFPPPPPVLLSTRQDGGPPVCEPAAGPITVKQLMTHTAGFTYGLFGDHPCDKAYQQGGVWSPGQTLAEFVGKVARQPLMYHPGTAWGYSVATDVLGHLVEVISGQTLAEFFEERIFRPLGMVDTAFYVPTEKAHRMCTLYTPEDPAAPLKGEPGGLQRVHADPDPGLKPPAMHSGGGGAVLNHVRLLPDKAPGTSCMPAPQFLLGRSSAALLGRHTLKFMMANQLPDGKSLPVASFAKVPFTEMLGDPPSSPVGPSPRYADYNMTMGRRLNAGRGAGFGLGFRVIDDPVLMGHLCGKGAASWGGLASTSFWVDPAEDLSVVFLTQLQPSSTYPEERIRMHNLVYSSLS